MGLLSVVKKVVNRGDSLGMVVNDRSTEINHWDAFGISRRDGESSLTMRGDKYLQPFTALSYFSSLNNAITYEELLNLALTDPIAFRTTFLEADDIVSGWFSVVDSDGKVVDEDNEIQEWLQEIGGKRLITTLLAKGLLFGKAWLVKWPKAKNNPYHRYLAICPLDFENYWADTFDEDGNYVPLKVKIRFTRNSRSLGVKTTTIPVEDYLFFRLWDYNFTDDGIPVLIPVYNDVRDISVIKRSFAERSRKYSGFPVISIQGATDSQLKEYKNRWGDFNTIKELFTNEKTTVDFKGLSGQNLNAENIYGPYIEGVSIGTANPASILRGNEGGAPRAQTTSAGNRYSRIANIQDKLSVVLEQFIEWQFPGMMKDKHLRWNVDYAYSDADKMAIKEIKASVAVMLEPYITDDAFARLISDLGITTKDIDKKNDFENGFDNNPLNAYTNQSEGMNPVEANMSRTTDSKKNPTVRGKSPHHY